MGRPQIPIGSSDFQELRKAGAGYIDKTGFVAGVLAAQGKVLLFPRPRRFGKTTNLSTLRYFVERSAKDHSALFADLAVWQDVAARRHFQRYPVIWLTFKDVKARSWAACREGIAGVLRRACAEHADLLDGDAVQSYEVEGIRAILEGRASDGQLASALGDLSQLLHAQNGERVFILIDEYDTPLHAAFTAGYYDEAVEFFRTLLSGGLKDNPALGKGVLTGILRVAKESLFSGLNNLVVFSLLRTEFNTSFGFTEEEVAALCQTLGHPEWLDGVRAWYNGYVFGGRLVYNPWSVMNFLGSEDKRFRPYWVSTSSNDLLMQILFQQGAGLRGELEALLRGEAIEKPIEEDVALRDIERRPEVVWSFLLMSGYLKATAVQMRERREFATLAIPNEEIFSAFEALVRNLMESHSGGEVDRLLAALLGGEEAALARYLQDFLLTSMSYHDPAGRYPERVFHAFVLGLLVNLRPRYEVRSNGESGFGRYDVMVLPREPGRPGVVLELKTVDTERGETQEEALKSALAQIRERRYSALLQERGATPIHEWAAAFDGRRVRVRRQAPLVPGTSD